MMPGMSSQMKNVQIDEDAGKKPKAIIQSMTPNERCLKDPISPSRKKRIADGAGVQIAEVNRFLKQFEQSKKMMKPDVRYDGWQETPRWIQVFRLDLNKFLYFIFYFRRNKQNGSKNQIKKNGL